jgi:hypothetical protein
MSFRCSRAHGDVSSMIMCAESLHYDSSAELHRGALIWAEQVRSAYDKVSYR